ncbi:zinc-binding alcohol dehydrogenase [Luteococcus sp. H138]|uniref:zinc-dependent alcohol dehydrogenase n=1 Tax=unclassified Luteococcus TaxID=2639923 RepID=UPI00313C6410
MGQVLRFTAPGQVDIVEESLPRMSGAQVHVQTLFSGISAGTELSAYRGTNPYLTRTWDPDLSLFLPEAGAGVAYPLTGWGYSEVGRVTEIGSDVDAVQVGDVVWGIWGHRTEALLNQESLRGHVMPLGAQPEAGTFSRVASVALNAVLNAQLGIGSVVGVMGLGVIGLLSARFAVLSGATVIGIDPIASRRELAAAWGAHHVMPPSADLALQVRGLTDGLGADVVLELSGNDQALHESTRLVGRDGIVVASGFYQGAATNLWLGEEFHHNRVRLQCSQIGSVPPQLASRWSRERLVQAATSRVLQGDPDVGSLISHRYPLDEASRAYQLLDQHGNQTLQVLFTMGED